MSSFQDFSFPSSTIPENELIDFQLQSPSSSFNPATLASSLSSSMRRGSSMGEVPTGKISKSRKKSVSGDDESKRKDNINEKIQELLDLIPPQFFVENDSKASGTKDGKPNKGQILSKAVEYISALQGKIDERNRKEVELILKLKEVAQKKGVSPGINVENTSAEETLAHIGVGPLAQQREGQFEYTGYSELDG